MSEEYLPHLWIPDEEVEQFEKKHVHSRKIEI